MGMMGNTKEMIYVSALQGLAFKNDVLAIVRSARRNNISHGVTGLLVYDGAVLP